MVWRYIKAQLMVLLCGGLVGPIFLGVYFATGQSSLLKWMFYVGLLIIAADVLIALAIANFGAKSAAKTQALEQSGVLALAQITGMGETGTRINDQPLVKLQLRIEGPGIAPFDYAGPRHSQRDEAWQSHQPKAGGARRSGDPAIPDRLGTKRFDQRAGSGDVHHR